MANCHVSFSSSSSVARGTVETVSGSDVAVHAYRGIPYAQPPVGPLRFCPPKPTQLWTGERDCAKFGAICPQPIQISKFVHKDLPFPEVTSEDCLFLNVYAPATANRDSRLPVMVWIHGGAFTIGYGDYYEGTQLASFNDVVVVTINYRLGAFGFLTTGDDVIPGNNGLLDQIEALRWVKTHIEAFGGNPENVTIFGESAGAMSTSILVVSEMSRGLFHRAISQSGAGTSRYAVVTQKRARELVQSALDKMGYKGETSEDLVSFLRSKSSEELGNMAAELMNFRPVVDGAFLTDFPANLYKDGKFQDVPLMTGFTSDEGYVNVRFLNGGKPLPDTLSKEQIRPFVLNELQRDFPENPETLTDAAIQKYITPEAETNARTFLRQFMDMITHKSFAAPSHVVAKRHSVRAPVYSFEFAYLSSTAEHPDWLKAEHGEDVIPVFGFRFRSDFRVKSCSQTDKDVSKFMMKYWTNFARTGDPNGKGLVKWEPFSTSDHSYIILQETPEGATQYCSDKMAFWEEEMLKWI